MKRIAIDIDDVLLDYVSTFVKFHNFTYNTSLKKEDIFSYNLWESFKETPKQMETKLDEFVNSQFFNEIPPIEGARNSLEILNKDYRIFMITSRSIERKQKTDFSLEKYFPNLYSKIFYIKNERKTKAEICKEQEVSLLIEDCPKYAFECNSSKIPVFLFTQPWNKNLNLRDSLITRVKDWGYITKKLEI